MRFAVLGPMLVERPDGEVVGGGRLRATMLALLLVKANAPVSADSLIDAVWGGAADDKAAQKLQVHVHRLRRLLDSPDRLTFRDGAYCLRVAPDELDATRFTALVAAAGAESQPARTVELCRTALALWRSTPFEGLDAPTLRVEAQRLAELRLETLERLYAAELTLGRHSEVIAGLTDLVREHPLREQLQAQLMTALYRAGRQADALRVYRETRTRLVEELGVEPGEELRSLEQRMLAGEPLKSVVPAQLPHDVTAFVGRTDTLSELDALLAGGRRATLISAVAGTAGVGKTALAVRWAHRNRDAFPDGQLYVDLHGYGPEEPLSAHDALAGFLTAFGVTDLPAATAERAARFRTLLDGRTVLVVLDNVRTVEQVRPLLPGAGSCFVLVTSRDSLAGLVARDGAHRVDLDRLGPAESVGLLGELVGPRLADQPDLAAALAERCARLPLALRVAAEYIRARPARPVADLLAELSDEQRALDVLDADGDPHTAVRAVFSWSYRHLPDDAGRLFRLFGGFPGHDADGPALAALGGADLRSTRRTLDTLVRAHLAEETGAGRYRQHDLLRAYAAELAEQEDGVDDRRAALDRLLDHYLLTTRAAMGLVAPADRRMRPTLDADHDEPPFPDYRAAMRWLDTERRNLLTAADHGSHCYAVRLLPMIWRYLDLGGHHVESNSLATTTLRLAEEAGDVVGEVHALRVLGVGTARLSRYRDGGELFARALARFREVAAERELPFADEALLPALLNNVGVVHHVVGDYAAARSAFEEAVAVHDRMGNHAMRRYPLSNLATTYRRLGDYDRAAALFAEVLALAEEYGDHVGGTSVLIYLAELDIDLGRLESALTHAHDGLARAIEVGNHVIANTARDRLGCIYRELGDLDRALRYADDAVRAARLTGNSILLAESLNSTGATCLATGELDAATEWHREALAVATSSDQRAEQARAHSGLGDVHAARGDRTAARAEWQRALDLYEDTGMAYAALARARLTEPG